MSKLVVVKVNEGDWERGFPIILQVAEEGHSPSLEVTGKFPGNQELPKFYEEWQSLYRSLPTVSRLTAPAHQVTNVAIPEDCYQKVQDLGNHLNHWFDSETFRPLKERLLESLDPSDSIRVIIQTADAQMQRLPWHLLTFFEHFQKAEVAISPPSYEKVWQKKESSFKKIRILAILGNSEGINVNADREFLENLPGAETVFLVEPPRRDISERLWEQQWDIFFFAGHSCSNTQTGLIQINSEESLTLGKLKHGLRKAIKRGLQLAIFNSCDGLGLAQELASLSIPEVIVMREPVPDQVAQDFLKYFLKAFSEGQSLYLSVRTARERLYDEGLEKEIPGVTWLPVIFQNPATLPFRWSAYNSKKRSYHWKELKTVAMKSFLMTGLLMGLRWMGVFQGIELIAYDTLVQQRSAELIDPRITVMEITDEDISHYGYPLSDQILGEAITKLEQYHPRVIGIDIHRSQVEKEEREKLINSLREKKHIILVCSFNNSNRHYQPHPDIPIQQLGFSDLLLESGDKVRRQLISYNPNLNDYQSLCATPYSLSWQLSYRYLKQENISPLTVTQQGTWQFAQVKFQKLSKKFGGYQTLDGKMSQIMINYRSKAQAGQRITLSALLNGEIKAQSLKDKIILIGYGSSDVVRDDFQTPIGTLPGVWIHANMTSQMVSAVLDGRTLIRAFPQWGDTLWIWVGTVGTGILFFGLKIYFPQHTILSSIILFAIISMILYAVCRFSLSHGLWLPWIPTQIGLLIMLGGRLIPDFLTFYITTRNSEDLP